MASPRILTFNFHEPYICLMAKTGYALDIGMYGRGPLHRPWQEAFRPMPPNVTPVDEAVWRADVAARRYDVVIAHNEMNAADLLNGPAPLLVVCHNRLSFLKDNIAEDRENQLRAIDDLLGRLAESAEFIFISESKRADYGLPGRVIPPGIDVEEYGGYRGDVECVLRVGNMMRARTLMFDVDFQEEVCAGLPNRVLGYDPKIPAAAPAESFEALLSAYRSCRCLLHVTREAYEDGYNLSMLEAMACGMPVAALTNRTSPLTDGVDGCAADTAEALRQRLERLLREPDYAREIGAQGRQTAARTFPLGAFVERWREAIETAAQRARRGPVLAAMPKGGTPRLNLLLEYAAAPYTTGRYIERALRRWHRVVSAGIHLPDAIIETWGFAGNPPPNPKHDVDLPFPHTCQDLLDRLPEGFRPDMYFWVDSGVKEIAEDVERIEVPRICYMIDTHLAPEPRIEVARHFHFTFLAQKAQVQMFRDAGVQNVNWCPLACSPELHHAAGRCERDVDVAYVGHTSSAIDARRVALLEAVQARVPNTVLGQRHPEEMARLYARAKIVVNVAVNRDVNMRVFEAMAAGALLITDEADGLEDLFQDGAHLVIFRRDEDLVPLVERYLNDSEARVRIAAAGQALVLEEHTYDKRMQQMLDCVLDTPFAVNPYRGHGKFQPGGYYRCPRPELAAQVPEGTMRLLDVGCGGGEFGRYMKHRGVREVVGIEVVEDAWRIARQVLDDALLGNLETMELPFSDGYFDCIVCGDVLEHLIEPAAALRKLRRVLSPGGQIIISIPNIRCHETVRMLVDYGRWQYQPAGLMDRTHLRFFTRTELQLMVEEAGLEAVRLEPLSRYSTDVLPRRPDGSVQTGRMTIGPLSDAEYEEFLTYQWLAVALKPDPAPLRRAREALDAGRFDAAYLAAQRAGGADPAEREAILAKAAAQLGRLEEAEGHYRKAVEAAPERADLRGDLGVMLVAAQRSAEARPLLEAALDAQPGEARLLGALGLAHLSEGSLDEAYRAFEQALDARIDNDAIAGHFLQTAYELGREQDAAPVIGAYAAFFPGKFDAVYAHAALLYRLGRHAEARERLDTLLLFDPAHEPARALMNQLRGADAAGQ